MFGAINLWRQIGVGKVVLTVGPSARTGIISFNYKRSRNLVLRTITIYRPLVSV